MIPYDGKLSIMESTIGALVVDPNPGIYGMGDNDSIVSVDFSSLYPTVMTMYNISFQTIKHRVYDAYAVDKLIMMLDTFNASKSHKYQEIFNDQIESLIKNFADKTKPNQKGKFIEYNVAKCKEQFKRICQFLIRNPVKDLFTPRTNDGYYILIECLYPLLEVFNKVHPNAPKNYCNETCVDYVFRRTEFKKEYGDQNFYVMDGVHSTKRSLRKVGYDEMVEKYLSKYIVTPAGTLITRHKDQLARLSKMIPEMQRDRKRIQLTGNDLYVIADYAKQNDKPELFDMINSEKWEEIEKIVPDYNDVDRMTEFDFRGYKFDDYEATMKFSKALGNAQGNLKIKLNSLYGVSGLKSYYIASPLISNSITIGSRITGIVFASEITNIDRLIELQAAS